MPLDEQINELELRVAKLSGEVSAKLDQVKVDKLRATAEGQSRLLKLYASSKRTSDRLLGTLAIITNTAGIASAAAWVANYPDTEMAFKIVETAGMPLFAITAAGIAYVGLKNSFWGDKVAKELKNLQK